MKTKMNFYECYIRDVKVDMSIDVEASMKEGQIEIYDAYFDTIMVEGFRYGNEQEYFIDEQLCKLVGEFITFDWKYFVDRLNSIKREEGAYV